MTEYQQSMIEKSKELETEARALTEKLSALYYDNGSIQAQDVARVTELHNKALILSEAAGRAEG